MNKLKLKKDEYKCNMKLLDVFAGIGGFSLALEKVGMQTVAFCEIDHSCQKVLRKHWPTIPIFPDIKTLNGVCIPSKIDICTAGFPCQSVSVAGNKRGLVEKDKTGLWYDFQKFIKKEKPRWVILENVRNLLNIGFEEILSGLENAGYNAEWKVISARSIGAPHLRERVWIVGWRKDAHADLQGFWPTDAEEKVSSWWGPMCQSKSGDWWANQPNVGRVVHGLSRELERIRRERIRMLGNSIVPFIAGIIGERIVEIDRKYQKDKERECGNEN